MFIRLRNKIMYLIGSIQFKYFNCGWMYDASEDALSIERAKHIVAKAKGATHIVDPETLIAAQRTLQRPSVK